MPETPLSFSHQHVEGRREVRKRTANNRLCPHARQIHGGENFSSFVRKSICTAAGCTWSYQPAALAACTCWDIANVGPLPQRTHARNSRGGKGLSLSPPSLLHEQKSPFAALVSSCICALIHLSMEEVERLAGLPFNSNTKSPLVARVGRAGSRGSTCPQCRSRVGCFVGKTYRNIGDTLSGTKR